MGNKLGDFTERYETVRLWMEHLRPPTKEYFARMFKRFCDWAKKNPDELIRERREQSQSTNDEERFKQEHLVERYLTELESMTEFKKSKHMKKPAGGRANYSPSYVKLNASAIRSFYHYNRADLHLIKRLESYNVKDVDAASKDQIRAMHDIADAKERALLLFQYHSGLRNGTMAKLTLGDIKSMDPKRAPVTIQIAPEKAKRRPPHYRSFLSKEAIEALNVYLETRRRGEVFRGAKPEKLTPSSPVFRETLAGEIKPMTSVAISKVIARLAKRAGFSNVTAHSLRRSFQTTLESAGVPPNWIKLMMGHKLPGVEGAYSKPSVEQMGEAYKEKAEPALSISEAKPVLTSGKIEELVEKRASELVDARMAEFEKKLVTNPELLEKLVASISAMRGPKGEFVVGVEKLEK